MKKNHAVWGSILLGSLFGLLSTSLLSFGEVSQTTSHQDAQNAVMAFLRHQQSIAASQVKSAREKEEAARTSLSLWSGSKNSHSPEEDSSNPRSQEQKETLEQQLQAASAAVTEAEAKLAVAERQINNLDTQETLTRFWKNTNNLVEENLGPHVAKPEDQKASPLGQALEDMLLRAKEEFDEDRYLASLMADGFPKEEAQKIVQHDKQFLDQAMKAVSLYNSGNRFLARENPRAIERAEDFWNKSILLPILGPYRNTSTQAGMTSLLSGIRKLFLE